VRERPRAQIAEAIGDSRRPPGQAIHGRRELGEFRGDVVPSGAARETDDRLLVLIPAVGATGPVAGLTARRNPGAVADKFGGGRDAERIKMRGPHSVTRPGAERRVHEGEFARDVAGIPRCRFEFLHVDAFKVDAHRDAERIDGPAERGQASRVDEHDAQDGGEGDFGRLAPLFLARGEVNEFGDER